MEVSLGKLVHEPEVDGSDRGTAAASGTVTYVPSMAASERPPEPGAQLIGFRQDPDENEGLADPPAAGLREAPLG